MITFLLGFIAILLFCLVVSNRQASTAFDAVVIGILRGFRDLCLVVIILAGGIALLIWLL